MKKNLLFTLIIFLMTFATYAQTLDQSNTVISSTTTGNTIGQSFTAGLTGTLSQFNFNNFVQSTVTYPLSCKLYIYEGSGNTGALLGTQNFILTDADGGEFEIPISSNINITSGNIYTAYIVPENETSGFIGFESSDGDGVYPFGSIYVGNTTASADILFKTFVIGPPATHLDFGAANDYVDCGNGSSLQITGNTITLEAYVKFNTFGAEHWLGNIINKASPNSSGYMLRAGGNGAVNFVVANYGWHELTTADNAITLDTWFHIAGVYNGTTSKIYIDGIEVASTNIAMGNIGDSAFNVNLGRDPQDTDRGLDASLDEVRIWNIARNETQINAGKNCELQGDETGLVAYYKFNQGVDAADNTAISTITDATSNGNDGVLTNFTLLGTASNLLAGSPVTTGSIIPSEATVTTPVTYTQGDTASQLTATTGSNGTGLMWYTSETGGSGLSTAPSPSTATIGATSYWVSSTNANGCESKRTEIIVNVYAPATHLNFDGSNDYIELANEANFDFTTEMTVELWMNSNYTNPEEWDGLVTKGDDSWRLHLNVSGTVNFACSGTSITTDGNSTTIVTDGNWHHIAGTLGNNTVSLYIDGVEEFTTAAPEALNNSSFPVAIGQNLQQAGRFYSGNMEDVRIWNITRTAEQINGSKNCELQGSEAGLVAYYKFNQGNDSEDNTSETTVIDATGANNGILNNFSLTGTTSNWLAGSPVTIGSIVPSAATVATPVAYNEGDIASQLTATTGTNGTGLMWYATQTGGIGDVNATTPDTSIVGATSYWVASTNANGCESERTEIVVNVYAPATHLNFDGVDDHVILPNESNYDFTTDLTIEFMIKTTYFDGLDGFITKGNSSWRIHGGSNGTVMFAGNNSFNDFSSTTSIDDDIWHHVAVTYNGSAAKIYVDGILESSYAASNPIQTNSDPIVIGAMKENTYTSRFFKGNIDEVRIWNIARTEEQIFGSKNCELQGTETGLVSYYKFNQGVSAADNTAIITLTDATSNDNNGALTSFALTGTTSNWLAGSPVEVAPVIAVQPQDQSVSDTDTSVVFTVTATNVTSYQWEAYDADGDFWFLMDDSYTDPDVSGSTTNTLTISGNNLAFIFDLKFRVVLNGGSDCSIFSNEVVATETLGIPSFELDAIKVYPNPTKNVLNISNTLNSNLQLSVYDINGRLLLNKNCDQEMNTIDISTFSNGMYLLRMKTDFGVITKRVIKD